jgi:DNA primase
MRGDAHTVKERVDIVDLIGGYIKLEKAGQNFKARCPFHNEKTASFHISPSRQTYYCFGCGKKGDVFTFVEEMEGTDFRGALKILADKAGVELVNAPAESRGEKEKLYEVLLEAAKFFEENLEDSPKALAYLKSRGLTSESIKKFRIGYAPNDWRKLRAHLLSLGYPDDVLVKAGLTKRTDDAAKEPYDVFRGRIIFPLMDASGKVIAFSGRSSEADVEPKYLNSPDTVLFTKSEVLYGLDKAKDDIRKKNYVILVEGQMDLVLSHQAGLTNTVASSGTAFTKAHLERLKQRSSNITLAFDGDNAGEKAAEKSVILALLLGLEVKIVTLPIGKDPADLVRDNPESWRNVLRKPVKAIEFFLEQILKMENDPIKRDRMIRIKVLPMIKCVKDKTDQGHYLTTVQRRAGYDQSLLREAMQNIKLPSVDQLEGKAEEAIQDIKSEPITRKALIEKALEEIKIWQKDDITKADLDKLKKDEEELKNNLAFEKLKDDLRNLLSKLSKAESGKEDGETKRLTQEIQAVHKEMKKLEEDRKVLYN